MRYTLIILSLFSFVGCNGVQRLIDGPHSSAPNQGNVNPNDYTVSGIIQTTQDVVSLPVKHRTIIVQAYLNGQWYTLRGNYKDYIAFVVPTEGVCFMSGALPVGTQYRIRTIAEGE